VNASKDGCHVLDEPAQLLTAQLEPAQLETAQLETAQLDNVEREQFRLSVRQLVSLNMLTLTCTTWLILGVLWWADQSPLVLCSWLGAHAIVNGLQFVLLKSAQSQAESAEMKTLRRRRLMIDLSNAAVGIEFATIAVIGAIKAPLIEQWMTTVLLVLGFATAHIAVGFGRRVMWMWLALPMFGLAGLSSFLTGGPIGWVFGAGSVLFLLCMLIVNEQISAAAGDSIRLRFELQRANEELASSAITDELTGLINRMGMRREITNRRHKATGVLFLDLDGFKEVNDIYGHEAGDLVLQVVADRLRTLMRDGDVAIRLGGDEFLLLLNGGRAVAADMAPRVQDAVTRPMLFNGVSLSVGTSIGAAASSEVSSLEDAIADADRQMYLQKAVSRRERNAPRPQPIVSLADTSSLTNR
jgi:diguanylate cyclase (GGDEF)-like protein